jgi:hypothetical protein
VGHRRKPRRPRHPPDDQPGHQADDRRRVSIGNAVENKVLDHLVANATYTAPTPSLGLWTSTVDDTSTAATAGELTYTTYARQSISPRT